jgi:hypothetical protein
MSSQARPSPSKTWLLQSRGMRSAAWPIGKSRLFYEFRRSLAGKPVTYCDGHGLSYGGATPYLPVLDLLRQLCGITDADSPRVITAKVRQHLQESGLDPGRRHLTCSTCWVARLGQND